jgi:hypothetical protein
MTAPVFEHYVAYAEPEPNPWRPEVITGYLTQLGATRPEVTQLDVESIQLSYDQAPSFRYFHGPGHGSFVGQPDAPPILMEQLSDRFTQQEAQAVLAIAGLFHDVAYKHVDVLPDGTRVWPSVLANRIQEYAQHSTEYTDTNVRRFRTQLTERGREDAATRMVAHIFGVGEDGIIHNQGGNEFDSALAAAKFLESKGTPPKHIVAVVSAIAATVPFKPAVGQGEQGQITDGHMGELAARVQTANLTLEGTTYQPDWTDTNDIMFLSVHLANRDISPFIRNDNFPQLISGGQSLRAEEIPELRPGGETTIRALGRAGWLGRSVGLLYGGLAGSSQPVSAADVPHFYIRRDGRGRPLNAEHSYPPYEIYQQSVANTERNARMATLFFQSHEAGVLTAASIAALIGEPDAPVPGIVHSRRWDANAVPQGATFDHLDEDEMTVYAELMYGAHQADVSVAVTQRSPIGGLILGSAGREGVARLSARIQEIRDAGAAANNLDPFSEPETARTFVRELITTIGPDNFRTLLGELARVARYYQDDPDHGAPDREARLWRLGEELLANSTAP